MVCAARITTMRKSRARVDSMKGAILGAAALAVVLFCCVSPARAASDASHTFKVDRAPSPPVSDSIEGGGWQSALRVDGFYNVTTKAPGALATDAYLTYDDRNLYVAFSAKQANVPIKATQTTNNVGFGIDDFVGIGIDTSGNGTRVLFFETT